MLEKPQKTINLIAPVLHKDLILVIILGLEARVTQQIEVPEVILGISDSMLISTKKICPLLIVPLKNVLKGVKAETSLKEARSQI